MNVVSKSKIFYDFESLKPLLTIWKGSNNTIVFTNGCFDIIHHGHVDSLQKSAALGTRLIVGLNSDQSVELLKGENRPVFSEQARAEILAAFECVDAVIIFKEETPAEIIAKILPDVLVKGAEYKIHEIAGHDTVLSNGGKVEILDLVDGISTTDIIDRIKKL
ncbi:D-glycero-beta-D-manno-heptose 1-phosphate adenylyltransferase [Prolixibacteraceae bacterium Z1-6]|uniref:D-glycero-beta-D-manno-heptose 1-phosphate adenylyltransferase n=1 Tax=Draconibacterium aestuarii TaxID=2998507 RepID=A0A9X3F627_9BACT|nr:D-glycero-beta-D-manno-heptose 1-phosphate adenylyltransferase [Prolixibacteraceae bacterium Z1-6]